MDITMTWFKSQIKKSVEKIVEFRVEKAVEELSQEETQLLEPKTEKLYDLIKLINNNLTVVLKNGEILSKPGATKEDYNEVLEAQSLIEIYYVMSSPEILQFQESKEKEIAKMEAISNGISILKNHEDFVFENNCVYMKNIKRSIPQMLVEHFAEVISVGNHEAYDALKKFWLKCCLNPNAQSAEDLYAFLQHHKFSIDNHGNFYAYRRVVSKDVANKELVEFVSNVYTKIKAVWKKSPKNFSIYAKNNSEYFFMPVSPTWDPTQDSAYVGNLEELYLNLPNMQNKSYTSAHTGLEDYRVGEVISMPRDNGDDNNKISCSKGFHAASKAYDYSGFGDTPILVIINPMDVLAVPKGEFGKLRTCRWFFATTLPQSEEFILDDASFDVSELGDIFEEKCSIDLENHVKNSFAEEVKRHTFVLSSVSSEEIKNIVMSLDVMRKAISTRVIVMKD